jgi:hypothetical protein
LSAANGNLSAGFSKGGPYADESALFALQGFNVCEAAFDCQPRRPEESVLYRAVAENLESFLARQQERGRVVPKFVENDLRDFLDCGILEREGVTPEIGSGLLSLPASSLFRGTTFLSDVYPA